MTHFIRAYLRASTNEQEVQLKRGSLDRFAHEHDVLICNSDDAELKEQILEILDEIHRMADFRNCEITDLTLKE
jgi:hypothetical protein